MKNRLIKKEIIGASEKIVSIRNINRIFLFYLFTVITGNIHYMYDIRKALPTGSSIYLDT